MATITKLQSSLRRPAAIGGLLLVVALTWNSSYLQNNLTTVVAYSLAALSLVVITGWTGQISLAQLSMMAFAAFVFGLLAGHDPFRGASMPWFVAVPVALGATTAFGVLVSAAAIRIRGLHFAVISLAIAYTIDVVIFTEGSIVPRGLQNLVFERPGRFADLRFFSLTCLFVLFVVIVLLRNLRRSSFGRAMMAVRDAELAAGVLGIDVVRCKLYALTVSSAVAALGGVLFIWKIGGVSTTALTLGLDKALLILALTVIAGTRSLVGGVVAGFLGVFLPEYAEKILHDQTYAVLVAGIGVMVLPTVLPDGLVSLPARLVERVRQRGDDGVESVSPETIDTREPMNVPA